MDTKTQVAFGHRDRYRQSAPLRPSSAKAKVSPEPSGAYAEIANAARSAFRAPADDLDKSLEGAPPQATVNEVVDEEEAMRAFIGPNWRAYRGQWKQGDEGHFGASFGYGPALLGGVWLVYRKLYILGFAAIAVEASLSCCAPLFAPFVAILLRAALATYGKGMLLKAGQAAIERAAQRSMTTGERLRELSKQGGVALGMATFAVLVESAIGASAWVYAAAPAGLDSVTLLSKVRDALP